MPDNRFVPPRHTYTGARKLPGFPAVLRHPDVSDAIDIAQCRCILAGVHAYRGRLVACKPRNDVQILDTDIHGDRVFTR
jgi:hypothetical protein